MAILITALLFSISPAIVQADAKPISFSSPATRAKLLFPALSKTLGIQLETSRQIADEVLLIRVKNTSTKELMERIADVTHAEWKAEGSGFRLIRSTDTKKRLERRELDDRAIDIRRALDTAAQKLKALPKWNAEEVVKLAKDAQGTTRTIQATQAGGIFLGGLNLKSVDKEVPNRAPSGRAIPALLNDIGAAKLAQIAPGARVVYALLPTAMQLSLPGNSPRVLRDYVEQEQQYAQAYVKTKKPEQPNQNGIIIIQGGGLPEPATGNPALGIGQALLVIQGSQDSLEAHLTVADTNGAPIASGSYTLGSFSKEFAKPTGLKPIVLSTLAQELATALSNENQGSAVTGNGTVSINITTITSGDSEPMTFSIGGDGPDKPAPKLSPELRNMILHPEIFDPLMFVPSDAFSNAAEQLGANLMADLTDTHYLDFTREFARRRKVGAEDLVNSVAVQYGVNAHLAGGWLTASPTSMAKETVNRVNRDALGQMLRLLDSNHMLRLDDLAAFSIQQEKPTDSGDIDGVYLGLINPTAAGKAQQDLGDPWTLRIYATLTPYQKSSADANRPIEVSELSNEQRNWLAHDVFNSYDGPQIPEVKFRDATGTSNVNVIQAERTQALPEGLPRAGQLTFKFEHKPAALGTNSKTGNSSVLTANQLASHLYQTEQSDPPLGKSGPSFDAFRPASQTTYNFNYRLTPLITFSRSLKDAFIDRKANAVSYKDLPEDFRASVDQRLAQMRNGIGKINFGGAGGPPPPTR